MAPIVLSAEEAGDALDKGGADIRYLFGSEQVDLDIQRIFFYVGVTTISKFASFATDVADLKKVMLEDFGLDGTSSIQNRVKLGAVIVAWNKASCRAAETAKIEGELDSKRMAKPLPSSDFGAMRSAFESKWWILADKWVPARSYLEKRADQLEQGDMQAERLSEVICREEDQQELMVPIWDHTGNLRIKKASSTVAEPINSEQLRYRVTLLGTALMFLGARHSGRSYLQGLSPQLFSTYLEYLLGDFCWNMLARTAEGHSVGAPVWSQVVSYEFQIRKKAYDDMARTGVAFASCLEKAWNCPITKERHFTTPLAFSSAGSQNKRNLQLAFPAPPPPSDHGGRGRGKGRGRGGSKGKGKGRGSSAGGGKGGKDSGKGFGLVGCAAKTPDGRSICFSYNNPEVNCTASRCTFVHCCGKCFGRHPMFGCPGNAARPATETQGGGPGM